MSIAINQQAEAGKAAFETWRDEIEPDGWGEGLQWNDLHPKTQEPWIDLARAVVEKWNAGAAAR